MLHTWLCMGCNRSRSPLGSKGQGIWKRCAECVEKRQTSWRYANSREAKMLRAIREAGPTGICSAELARAISSPMNELMRVRSECIARGTPMFSCKSGTGKGGGQLLHFEREEWADAYAQAHQKHRSTAHEIQAMERRSTASVVQEALRNRSPLEAALYAAACASQGVAP